jgi:hypothetical protein
MGLIDVIRAKKRWVTVELIPDCSLDKGPWIVRLLVLIIVKAVPFLFETAFSQPYTYQFGDRTDTIISPTLYRIVGYTHLPHRHVKGTPRLVLAG